MNPAILKNMSGHELLVLRILYGATVRKAVEAELDRRATLALRNVCRPVRQAAATRPQWARAA